MNNQSRTKEIAAVKEQVRLEAWRREAEAQRAPGLSVKAWCARNGVSQSGYYHRLRRLREAVCRQLGTEQDTMQTPAPPAVVPVRKSETVPPVSVATIEMETKGLRVWLPADCQQN